jgi:hypothetical protein
MDRIENDASNNSCIVACVFVAAVTIFTEPLPSNDRMDTHTDTQTDGRDLRSTLNSIKLV